LDTGVKFARSKTIGISVIVGQKQITFLIRLVSQTVTFSVDILAGVMSFVWLAVMAIGPVLFDDGIFYAFSAFRRLQCD